MNWKSIKTKMMFLKSRNPRETGIKINPISNHEKERLEENEKSVPVKKLESKSASYREMLRYAKFSDYLLLFFGVFFAVFAGTCMPFDAVIFRGIADILTTGQAAYTSGNFNYDEFSENIIYYCFLYFLQGIGMFLLNVLAIGCFYTLSERMCYEMKKHLFESLLNQDQEWFDKNEVGGITQLMSGGIEKIRQGTSDKIVFIIRASAHLVSSIVLAFYFSFELTLTMLVLAPFMAVSFQLCQKTLTSQTKKESAAYSVCGGIANEVLNFIKTVLSFNAQVFEIKRYSESLKKAQKVGFRKALVVSIFVAINEALHYCSYGVIYYYGGILVLSGKISSGTVHGISWCICAAALKFGMAVSQFPALIKAKVSARQIFDIIDTKPKLQKTGGLVPKATEGKVEFKNICFSYPSRPTIKILENISFEVKSGQNVALVGHSVSILSEEKAQEETETEELLKKSGIKPASGYQILKYAKPEMKFFVVGLLFAFLRGFSCPIFSILYGIFFKILSYPEDSSSYDLLCSVTIAFIILGVMCGFTTWVSGYIMGIVGEKLNMRLRMNIYKNWMRQDVSYYENPNHSVGRLTARLATDSNNVQAAVDQRLADTLNGITSFIIGIGVALYFGYQMTLFCILISGFFIIPQYIITKLVEKRAIREACLEDGISTIILESVSNVKMIQSLTQEEKICGKFCEASRNPLKKAIKRGWLMSSTLAIGACFVSFNSTASYIIGLLMIKFGCASPFIVFQVVEALTTATISLMEIVSYFPEYTRAKISAGIIFDILKEEPKIDNFSEGGVKPEIDGNVELEEVDFSYPNGMHTLTLNKTSIKAKFGQTVAIVGASGCGKSTVIQLIERFYDVFGGVLKIDGHDIRQINIRHLRSSMALVGQEPTLFNLSIRENISYGLENVPMEKIEAAAKLANVDKFIESLPDKYETSKLVQEALDRARDGRTCIVVAHRLGTIQNADLIYVLKNGRVREAGNHQQLLGKKGLYGHKFLVYATTNSKSHMIASGRLADTLAGGGHNVTVLVLEHSLSATEFKFTSQPMIIIGRVNKTNTELFDNRKKISVDTAFKGTSIMNTFQATTRWSESLITSCETALLENQRELNMLKKEKFDAILVGQLFPCGSALSHILGIKVHFLINSCTFMDHVAPFMGFPLPLGYVPTGGDLGVLDTMSFTERIANEVESWMLTGYLDSFHGTTELFRKHYGQDFPDVTKIIRQSPLVFTMIDELIDFPRPVFNKNINVGGLGMSTSSKALSEPFKTEIKKGKNGTVFFSLGSNVDTTFISYSIKKNFLDAFSEFPDYHFIVKLDKGDSEGLEYARKIRNVYVTHWAPQNELLQESELKLFITHGGYNSILEVGYAGKPCLLIPVMFDQHRNGKVVERNGWGRILNRKSLLTTKDELVKDLKEMLTNEKWIHEGCNKSEEAFKVETFLSQGTLSEEHPVCDGERWNAP
ncbi:hypothetical protein FO519_004154 [Halicephalobus sp. NKZ332]|nr:hypothetical protein FO519_004154 [Halicephalobus sp. NKZ332]